MLHYTKNIAANEEPNSLITPEIQKHSKWNPNGLYHSPTAITSIPQSIPFAVSSIPAGDDTLFSVWDAATKALSNEVFPES